MVLLWSLMAGHTATPSTHDHGEKSPDISLAQTVQHAQGQVAEFSSYLARLDGAFAGINHRLKGFIANIPAIPGHLQAAYASLTEDSAGFRIIALLSLSIAAIVFGFAIEAIARNVTGNFRRHLTISSQLNGLQKLGGLVLRFLLDLMGVTLFAGSSLLCFLLIPGYQSAFARHVFLCIWVPVLLARTAAAFALVLFAPDQPALRLLQLPDRTAVYLHGRTIWLTAYMAVTYSCYAELNHLNIPRYTVEFFGFVFGSGLVAMIVVLIGRHRESITSFLFGDRQAAGTPLEWLHDQIAATWHWLAFGYLFLVWLLWSHHLIISETHARSAFLISLLIGPIFLILDQTGQWLIKTAVGRFKDDHGQTCGDDPTQDAGRNRYMAAASRVVRWLLALALIFWLCDLWDFRIPFGEAIVRGAFTIFVTLFLAHILWMATEKFINTRLLKSLPPEPLETDHGSDEWGLAAAADRRYTLLPMLKKFLGSVIIVITTLIVLSALGVDIGPLMAGAGVIGLAIGFGAQKLVHDVLSGIFFLLDDAFRIGEYIEAGKASGVVEAITLRNIKLRHHRGMLQIIPYSDLGPVTNYMRGGIVVKFNIELPYGTDTDKVRKIVKKVGQAMLEDRELGPDFIKPLKSQGIRSVGDSVMTFRVKFTAKPGRHFIIRREAFRLITEALARQGIYYAHRKVIVDLPESLKDAETFRNLPEAAENDAPVISHQAVAAAGAAAARAVINRADQAGAKTLNE